MFEKTGAKLNVLGHVALSMSGKEQQLCPTDVVTSTH